ncbi:lysophospholipid acyltransferase family protein [Limnohabitans sp. Rim8]|uniref:lysophospholipid acyltransferase family protein n=1 Tax=Limnohabitans sp. Rim8 TaxID=1100718 RepID=UPI0033059797
MHRTLFDTPLVNTVLRAASVGFLKLTGWKLEGALPPGLEKCVVIAAPHTSNWDLPYLLMVAFGLNLKAYWMGKQSIFMPPFGPIMRWLGGIAVNREQASNMVDSCALALVQAEGAVHLVIPPEGTRSKTRYWKTGFYYIALKAQVPIVLGYMDYSRKVSGLGPLFYPTGDIEKDMLTIKAFYAPFKGKNPDQFESAA